MTKKINRSLSVVLSLIVVLCAAFTAKTASAADFRTVSGKFNYSYASEVLTLVNEERENAGLKPVTMTKSLTDGAMKRAAETAVSFSHTRPNGEQCFTAFTWTRAAGENIACGQRNPKEVMNGWMNSSGHRANILNSSFTTIGIGCFIYKGILYWSQAFSGGSGQSYAPSGERDVKVDVSLVSGTDSVVTFANGTEQNTESRNTSAKREETTRQRTTNNETTRKNQYTNRQYSTRRYVTREYTNAQKNTRSKRNAYSRIRCYFRYFFSWA